MSLGRLLRSLSKRAVPPASKTWAVSVLVACTSCEGPRFASEIDEAGVNVADGGTDSGVASPSTDAAADPGDDGGTVEGDPQSDAGEGPCARRPVGRLRSRCADSQGWRLAPDQRFHAPRWRDEQPVQRVPGAHAGHGRRAPLHELARDRADSLRAPVALHRAPRIGAPSGSRPSFHPKICPGAPFLLGSPGAARTVWSL